MENKITENAIAEGQNATADTQGATATNEKLKKVKIKKVKVKKAKIPSQPKEKTTAEKIAEIAATQKLNREWFKLDNAALIYPALNPKENAAIFRLSVLLKEEVEPLTLQRALNDVVPRFPTITSSLRTGLFWYYFDTPIAPVTVEIQDSYPALPIAINHRRPVVRVTYFGNEIACEFFHSACDGTGGLAFLNTLVGRYLTLRGVTIEDTTNYLNAFDKSGEEETEDSFQRVYDKTKRKIFKDVKAYHSRSTPLPGDQIIFRKIICSGNQVHEAAQKLGCSVTILLSALLLRAFAKERDFRASTDERPIKISVPINLRNHYQSKTIRNFSSYLYATYVKSDNLQQLVDALKEQWAKQNTKEYCDGMIGYNCSNQHNVLVKIAPIWLKNLILSLVYRAQGDALNTASFSNLGVIKAPKEFNDHIHRYEFAFGKTFALPLGMTVATFNDCMTIVFSSYVKETLIEQFFTEEFVSLGIGAAVECNDVKLYNSEAQL